MSRCQRVIKPGKMWVMTRHWGRLVHLPPRYILNSHLGGYWMEFARDGKDRFIPVGCAGADRCGHVAASVRALFSGQRRFAGDCICTLNRLTKCVFTARTTCLTRILRFGCKACHSWRSTRASDKNLWSNAVSAALTRHFRQKDWQTEKWE
jgi:hypothetical protein